MGRYLTVSSNNGNILTDPALLPKSVVSSLKLKTSNTLAYQSTVGEFWTAVGTAGAYITAPVNNVWETVTTQTGAGLLCNVIGPDSTTGVTINQIRITADGVETLISFPAIAYCRAVLGAVGASLYPVVAGTAGETTGIGNYYDYGFQSASIHGQMNYAILMTPSQIISQGLPVLQFKQSLKVEVLCDFIDTASPSMYAGATLFLES